MFQCPLVTMIFFFFFEAKPLPGSPGLHGERLTSPVALCSTLQVAGRLRAEKGVFVWGTGGSASKHF